MDNLNKLKSDISTLQAMSLSQMATAQVSSPLQNIFESLATIEEAMVRILFDMRVEGNATENELAQSNEYLKQYIIAHLSSFPRVGTLVTNIHDLFEIRENKEALKVI